MELQIKQHTIVFIGQFNPPIVHPQWLARKGIIGAAEADAAMLRVNHLEISDFDLSFCSIQVVANRFAISTKSEPHFPAIRDIALMIFQALPETNIHQLGINLNFHYALANLEEYLNFGYKVMGKAHIWDGLIPDAKLMRLQLQAPRLDRGEGNKNLTIGISPLITHLGVDLGMNDHYDLVTDEISSGGAQAITALEEWWETSLLESDKQMKGVANYGASAS